MSNTKAIETIFEEVKEAISEHIKDVGPEITPETHLISDLGADSLDLILIAETLNIDFEEYENKDFSVKEIVGILNNNSGGVGSPISNEDQHRIWLQDMKENGWEYGETYSEEDKKNPFVVPFSELPEIIKKSLGHLRALNKPVVLK